MTHDSDRNWNNDAAAALKLLADEDRGLGAPPELENRLRKEFRRDRSRQGRRIAWTAAIAAGMAAAAAVAILTMPGWRGEESPARPTGPVENSSSAAVTASANAGAPRSGTATVRALEQLQATDANRDRSKRSAAQQSRRTRRVIAATPRNEPQEVVTEFFPLMEAAPPFDRGELLRVSVPAWAMRSVGLPVDEDHLTDAVQADVLVGDEGLARSIRFVAVRR